MTKIGLTIYYILKVALLIYGVLFIISPKRMLNWFVEKDLNHLKNTQQEADKNKLVKDSKIMCRISGVYCVVVALMDSFFRSSAVAVILAYFIIPAIGLMLLEKILKKK